MNDDRLKDTGGKDYFDELLERVRDIRSSEKVFWRKVLDIYATSATILPTHGKARFSFRQYRTRCSMLPPA